MCTVIGMLPSLTGYPTLLMGSLAHSIVVVHDGMEFSDFF
jgi:hypothetical protein